MKAEDVFRYPVTDDAGRVVAYDLRPPEQQTSVLPSVEDVAQAVVESHPTWRFVGPGQREIAAAVLALFAAAVPRIKAEALREAADEWTQGAWALAHGIEGKLSRAQAVGDWLRFSADRIEADEQATFSATS